MPSGKNNLVKVNNKKKKGHALKYKRKNAT